MMDDWPEWQLRQTGYAYYAHPLSAEDRVEIRAVLGNLRDEGYAVRVVRLRDMSLAAIGYPTHYVIVEAETTVVESASQSRHVRAEDTIAAQTVASTPVAVAGEFGLEMEGLR